jgi:hypothetical protein
MRWGLCLAVVLPALLLPGAAQPVSRSVPPSVVAAGSTMVVDGSPFFPVFVWAACPHDIDRDLAAGVTVFMVHGEGCGSEDDFLAALGPRAYYVPAVGDTRDFSSDPRLLGYSQPDEPDGHGIRPEQLDTVPGAFVYLTLTPHFARDQPPLSNSIGKDLYPAYAAKANALGFDVYPLVQACGLGNSSLGLVYGEQRDLVALAGGRPTFQWIETSEQQGSCGSPVTASTVRAEAWLAIAGGARGLGYFTYAWPGGGPQSFAVSAEVSTAMAEVNAHIQSLAPILLAPLVRSVSSPRSDPVKIGARTFGGRTYLIAVNSFDVPVKWSRALPGPSRRRVTVVGESRAIGAVGGRVTDNFAGLATHIYVY